MAVTVTTNAALHWVICTRQLWLEPGILNNNIILASNKSPANFLSKEKLSINQSSTKFRKTYLPFFTAYNFQSPQKNKEHNNYALLPNFLALAMDP